MSASYGRFVLRGQDVSNLDAMEQFSYRMNITQSCLLSLVFPFRATFSYAKYCTLGSSKFPIFAYGTRPDTANIMANLNLTCADNLTAMIRGLNDTRERVVREPRIPLSGPVRASGTSATLATQPSKGFAANKHTRQERRLT